ncbi:hypothetical protein ACP4OV_031968 [Aristida adscensionis]
MYYMVSVIPVACYSRLMRHRELSCYVLVGLQLIAAYQDILPNLVQWIAASQLVGTVQCSLDEHEVSLSAIKQQTVR